MDGQSRLAAAADILAVDLGKSDVRRPLLHPQRRRTLVPLRRPPRRCHRSRTAGTSCRFATGIGAIRNSAS